MKLLPYKFREYIYKKLFILYDGFILIKEIISSLALFVFTISSILFLCLFLFDLGFKTVATNNLIILKGYLIILSGLFISKTILVLTQIQLKRWLSTIVAVIILFIIFLILSVHFHVFNYLPGKEHPVLSSEYAPIVGAIILIITETYRLSNYFDRIKLSPRLLFAGSFIFIIILGSGLLQMPNTTSRPISYLDALFTATSAVCVTGLIVVDTVTTFTPIGKGIILFLIQIGGLGIMAFTGFFSYIFVGSASLRERFILKDLFSGAQLGGMFKLLVKIFVLTFMIELAGSLLIYFALDENTTNRMIQAIFHSISAFCNAGFSIFPDGLTSMAYRNNHFLQITIGMLIILGGLGFPVLLTFFNIIKRWMKLKLNNLLGTKKEPKLIPVFVGQKLAFWTSMILLFTGMFLYYWFEKNNSLINIDSGDSIVISFFSSVSARTAGFNIVDITHWSYPTIFIMIMLMWVGASPGSTGGGIKTTTFALALRSTYNYCRGRKYFEIGNREIGMPTLVKVLATITVSILIILLACILLLIFEPSRNPVHLLFECFSAFSTVGLSLVDTSTLSVNSKIVIILLMYIGRISPIIILSGLLLSKTHKNYRLPVENIPIN